MTVFVTGASGFLGSHLVTRLVGQGHSVRSYGRSACLPAELVGANIEHVQGDILNADALWRAISGCKYVFHLAGLVSYRKSDFERLHATNVLGTRNVLEAARRASVERLIHVSSIAGMGIPPAGTIGNEKMEYNLRGLGLYYCDSKYGGEMEVLTYARRGLPALILSPGITFGEGDTHPHHHTIFKSLASGRMLGYPKGGVTFSDIEDVVATACNALRMGREGERYVVGSANYTFKEASQIVSKVIGGRPPVFPIPGLLSELAGSACETIFPLFGLTPVLTRQIAWLSQREIFFSSAKAIAELAHKQTPFEETVRRTATYYLPGTSIL